MFLKDDIHVYGRPSPEGYIPIELTLEGEDTIQIDHVEYPKPDIMEFPLFKEKLPVYHGKIKIKARGRQMTQYSGRTFTVKATLRYQACDKQQWYLPQTLSFALPLEYLPHDWDRIKLEEE